MAVGAALFVGCLYMLLYAGHLKQVAANWDMISHQRHSRTDEDYAARNWPGVQAFEQDHPLLWEIAPYFPPYGWLNKDFAYSLPFFKLNWRFFAYLILLSSSAAMVGSGLQLQKLLDQLNHEGFNRDRDGL